MMKINWSKLMSNELNDCLVRENLKQVINLTKATHIGVTVYGGNAWENTSATVLKKVLDASKFVGVEAMVYINLVIQETPRINIGLQLTVDYFDDNIPYWTLDDCIFEDEIKLPNDTYDDIIERYTKKDLLKKFIES